MGRKNCAVIMLTSACLVLTACAPTEFPEQNGTEHQNHGVTLTSSVLMTQVLELVIFPMSP